ncbi:hypothetical protein J6590_028344 [Homalodisca vitripennis]|nr:hypothetical protein J6590_028344 [Homalodisca vitripennis]
MPHTHSGSHAFTASLADANWDKISIKRKLAIRQVTAAAAATPAAAAAPRCHNFCIISQLGIGAPLHIYDSCVIKEKTRFSNKSRLDIVGTLHTARRTVEDSTGRTEDTFVGSEAKAKGESGRVESGSGELGVPSSTQLLRPSWEVELDWVVFVNPGRAADHLITVAQSAPTRQLSELAIPSSVWYENVQFGELEDSSVFGIFKRHLR